MTQGAVVTEKKRIQITLSDQLLWELDGMRSQLGLSRSAAIAIAVKEWLKREGEGKRD